MIPPEEYEALRWALLEDEKTLNEMGRKEVKTHSGEIYALRERALSEDKCTEQLLYNKCAEGVNDRRKVIEALNDIARYKLAYCKGA